MGKVARVRRLTAKVLLLVLSGIVALAVGEWGFRLLARSRYNRKIQEFTHPMIKPTPGDPIHFVMHPNHSREMLVPGDGHRPDFHWRFRTNAHGLRGGPVVVKREDESQRRLLVIGDSYVFGFAVESEEDILTGHLRRLLNRDRQGLTRVQVINAGVPGYSSVQEQVQLERLIDVFYPHVVLLGYVMNDAEPLAHVPYPPECYYHSANSWILQQGKVLVNDLLGSEVFAPTWPVNDNDYLDSFAPANPAWKESRSALERMAALCRNRGIPLVVAIMPDFEQPFDQSYAYQSIHDKVASWGEEDGYPVFDLMPAFRNRDNREFIVIGEGHPNGRAHEVMAEYLRSGLEKLLLLE